MKKFSKFFGEVHSQQDCRFTPTVLRGTERMSFKEIFHDSNFTKGSHLYRSRKKNLHFELNPVNLVQCSKSISA